MIQVDSRTLESQTRELVRWARELGEERLPYTSVVAFCVYLIKGVQTTVSGTFSAFTGIPSQSLNGRRFIELRAAARAGHTHTHSAKDLSSLPMHPGTALGMCACSLSAQRATATKKLRAGFRLVTCAQLSDAGS